MTFPMMIWILLTGVIRSIRIVPVSDSLAKVMDDISAVTIIIIKVMMPGTNI